MILNSVYMDMGGGHEIGLLCLILLYICFESIDCCRIWDKNHLQCKECFPGYLGWNCSEQCRYPNFGRGCQGLCECEKKFCDMATGCFSPNANCPPGYLGRSCSERCRYPNYGRDCQAQCACEEKFCDVATGCIAQDEADCPSGYLGHNCSQQCSYPYHGKNCQGLCECEEKLCDIASGCFSPDVGCIAGYYGERCRNKCQYPFYGKDCQKLCECTEDICNFTTGCEAPKRNNLKPDKSNQPVEQHITGNTFIAIIVSVSVLSSILMSTVISIVIWRLKRPNRINRRAKQVQQTTNIAKGAANTYCFNDDARLSHFYSSPIETSSLTCPE